MDEPVQPPTLDDFADYYNWLRATGQPVQEYLDLYYDSYAPLQGEHTKLVVSLDAEGNAIGIVWSLPEMIMYSDYSFTYEGRPRPEVADG